MSETFKRVIITGGTRGIGKAIVEELSTKHLNGTTSSIIVFVYHNSDNSASELEKKIKSQGTKILGIKSDVSSYIQTQEAVKKAIEFLGGVDILINNAGITRDSLLLRMSEENFDQVINVNLKSVFNFTKFILPFMIKQKYGRIINITSVVGLIGNAGQSNYASSKAGIIGFTKSMAKEVASRNITVNAIAPGFIETEMTANLNEKQREVLINNIPLGRLGKPEDIARVVSFLCSEDADYITGQVISVDGGMVM